MKSAFSFQAAQQRAVLLFAVLSCLALPLCHAQEAPASQPAPATTAPAPSAEQNGAPVVTPAPAPAAPPAPAPAPAPSAAQFPAPAPAPVPATVPAAPAPAPSPAPAYAPAPSAAAPARVLPAAPQPAPVRNVFPENDITEYQNVRVQLSGAQDTQSIAEPFHLQVKVSNRTGDEIAISKVRWELPRSIIATRPQESSPAAGESSVPWFQGIAVTQPDILPYGGEQLFDLTMPDIHENWWTLPRNVRLMSFKPGEYQVKVRVEYAAGPYHRTSVAEEVVRVRFDTTPWFYVWGGIIGSMIGVLFEFFYTAARRIDQFEWPRDDRGRVAPGYAIRDAVAFLFRWVVGGTAKWLTGSLTAAIVLLFLYYYKDVQLPITIQINDFFGAVVVGLVAHRLGLWVYDTLFSRPEKPRGRGQGGAGGENLGFPQQVVPALTYYER